MRVVILGATSAIAEATARIYASEGASLFLVARNESRLRAIADDLHVRGARKVDTKCLDLVSCENRGDVFASAREESGNIGVVIVAYGTLGDQTEAETKPAAAAEILETNFTSAALWCLAAANALEQQGKGSLVVIGSVAGDRGRRANFVYGSAKAGLEALVEGISHRFSNKGPRAALVKPGPTITPMTEGMDRGGLLWATPEQVAKVVHKSAKSGGCFYAPWFWRYIMLIIRNLPSSIFNRMDI